MRSSDRRSAVPFDVFVTKGAVGAAVMMECSIENSGSHNFCKEWATVEVPYVHGFMAVPSIEGRLGLGLKQDGLL